MDIEWIREGLKKPGKSKIGLAKALSRSPSMVTALLDGKRQLKAREIETVARYLDLEAPVQEPKRSEPRIATLNIIGEVAAGIFADEDADAFQPIPVQVPINPDFPETAQYLLRVRGTSVNRRAPDGSLVLCLNIYSAPRPPKDGDWVVVRRSSHGRYESTAKQLRVRPDGTKELWPDSTDPKFQEPVSFHSDEDCEVEIVAFVLNFVNIGTIF